MDRDTKGQKAPMDERYQRLVTERVRTLAAQIQRGRVATTIVLVALSGIFVPSVGIQPTLIWVICMLIAFRLRDRFIRRLLEREPMPDNAEDQIALSSAALSIVINSPSVLFLPHMSAELSGVYVALIISWMVVGVLIIGIHPRAYTWFVVIGFLFLGIGWWRLLDPEVAIFAIFSMAAGAVMLIGFSWESAKTFNESIGIRFERDKTIAERDALINQRSVFLAQTTHDLLQPVNALLILIGVLRDSDSAEKREGAIERIEITAKSIESMFRGLLDEARLEQRAIVPHLTNVTLSIVFRSIEAAYAPRCEKKGISLSLDCPEDIMVTADAALLDRILRNLVDNAVKFTESGSIALSAEPQAGHIRVRVKDSGPGIDSSDLSRVTEAFFRASDVAADVQGIGLGLSVAKQLADLMEGSLDIDSEPGRGTEITLLLPQPVGPVQPESLPAEEPPETILDRKILLLEDDTGSREALELFLSHHGAEVCACGTLEQALSEIASGEIEPDQILVDFDLGEGPNGLEAIGMIREKIGPVPAALVTGAAITREAVPADIALLRKPHSDSSLLNFLERGEAESVP